MVGKSLGLIINPIAGMGGRVGLKGTDGAGTVERALALGAVPLSPVWAAAALRVVAQSLGTDLPVVTAPGVMGEAVAHSCEFSPRVVSTLSGETTTGLDTQRAAREMSDAGVDLLLFAGGDGTARDICQAVGTRLPALGIPTGVKMHSAVYATTPRAAGEVAARFLKRSSASCHEAEVMDIDEEAFRAGRVSAKLYGHLLVPDAQGYVQGLKSGRGGGEASELAGIAAEMARRMQDGAIYLIGPGTTTRAITSRLCIEKTLLGVDVVYRGELVARDVTERQALDHVQGGAAKIVVTPIGGQGYLFGRGNQQLSGEVIRRVGRANIIVVATPSKLAALGGQPLLVDTGDPEIDAVLAGYLRVVTGLGTESVYRVA